MNTTWNKTSLTLMMLDPNNKKVRFTYSNLIEKPSDDQIAKFAAVIAQLTGTVFVSASIATVDDKIQTV
ncbi:hypothetical protein [Secundilactobacillus folii]|uniref:DUF1659 domain-containing protein n=1 Tax=Secundilactobacillus folii TaxID=2678357 RepID=A0A7X3C3K3_9LACO|nr:hypothetical protein [Secundilactobacillus folii]MTV82696.1 hypothetical protein [Secundilactobacillus folii]